MIVAITDQFSQRRLIGETGVNGDSFVAMLVSSKMGELDRGVYNGTTTVQADEIDMAAMDAQFAKADAAD